MERHNSQTERGYFNLWKGITAGPNKGEQEPNRVAATEIKSWAGINPYTAVELPGMYRLARGTLYIEIIMKRLSG